MGADGLVRRPALVADGFDGAEIDRMLRSGVLVAVRRGVYRLAGGDSPRAEDDHRLRARAAGPELVSGAVFGFVTAAVLLGLPVWRIPLRRLHVVRDRSNGARIRGDLQIHGGRLPEGDVLELAGGLRVTSPARTVVDLARTVAAPQALVTIDGALHRRIVAERARRPDPAAATTGEIIRALGASANWSGSRAARRAVAFADGRSESPGETLSRFRMHVAGLPAPVLQWPVPGTRLRTDFAWPDRGVVGEFDGRTKYGRSPRPGADPAEVLWQEKRREDRIRAEGLTVVRWTFPEIDDPGPNGMAARLRPLVGP
ncbi:hypothetical protein [Pseudonocardia sp. NPDC046786]|uniref:type IV toxin-antitoxin system AbiEi family antitoxin domain-containing protein n=1 Tax=Pseudonocardia sp. NPDC046786 TaxID=3155471 RepID=UPI003405C781